MSLQPGQRILHDTYEVEEMIGRGAFAAVYRVRHVRLHLLRAVKVMSREDPGVGSTDYNLHRLRFEQEAYIGASLRHPNIVHAYDFYEDDRHLYLVMEYMAGGSLHQRIENVRRGWPPLPVKDVVQMGLDVAQGLAALHARDIVHRDLKPSNILFDGEGRAKVADLGLAQVPGGPSQRDLLSEGGAPPQPGTLLYMSPEQDKSTHLLLPASDLYTLGLILAEALTARVWKRYLRRHPNARVRHLREDVPQWLDDLIQWLLAPEIDARPQSAQQVIDVLMAYKDKGEDSAVSTPIRSHDGREDLPLEASGDVSAVTDTEAILHLYPGHPRYPTLADAVAAVPPGGTIHLAPGVYRLRETLVIDKPLTLVGEDRDMTVVAYEGDGDVVRYTGAGVFKARHITFRHLGGTWGNVMVVDDGLVDLEQCRFTGGVWSEEQKRGGTGILFWKMAVGGKVVHCLCDHNGLHGIEVYGQATPSLVGNRCEKNAQSGIVYWEESGGEARENECRENGLHGISVRGHAAPTLVGNRCEKNAQDGIVYWEESGGEARENVCRENGLDGIAVLERAVPVLKNNVCTGNKRGNLYVAPTAKPVLKGNRC